MTTGPEPRRRTGGRSARVREATLRAAMNLLLEHGYDGLSIGEVARAAGVAETTVYRRWPTRAELAAAALAEFAAAENPLPDTGTLAGDLSALLAQILDLLRRPDIERIIRAISAVGSGTDASAAARRTFFDTRFAGSGELVSRAIARGELPADTDPEAVLEFLVAPAYVRLLLTGRPLDDRLHAESVHRTLAAYRPGNT